MRDLMNTVHPKVGITPATPTDNTAQVGPIIDKLGYDSLTYLLGFGTLADADATFTVLLEHGDVADLSDAVAVPDTDLIGTEALAGFTFAADGGCRKLGYAGNKRYVRMTVTPVNNAGAAPMAAIALLGHPSISPTANPPA
jgi:hypothetical protein